MEGLHYVIYGVRMHLFYRPLHCADLPDAQRAAPDAKLLYDGILRPWERFNLQTRLESEAGS